MNYLLIAILLNLNFTLHAKVTPLFHPEGETLTTVAKWIEMSKESVDIAMYNMETKSGPIIETLKSRSVQKRLKDGDLRIRLLFEGYGTKEENEAKMGDLEALGIDVRYLGSSKKVHHKFAVIDGGEKLITGSANWSLNSWQNYHENILFIEDETEIAMAFQNEFENLWSLSKEFGLDYNHPAYEVNENHLDPDLQVYFNSEVSLTDIVIEGIESATESIKIATTRIKLKEVADALLAAHKRGVKIEIVVSMDEYKCAAGKSYSRSLSKVVDVRVKIYSFKPCDYLKYQMHNKYMVVDQKTLYTGSFNWSQSSENNHIENLVVLKRDSHKRALLSYIENFNTIWEFNRDTFDYEGPIRRGECSFVPTTLSFKEADLLYKKGGCRSLANG